MTEGKQSPTAEELIKLLSSGDPAAVSKALHKLEKTASIQNLPQIIRIMAGIKDPAVLQQFTGFISNIRSKEAPAVIAGFLSDPGFSAIRTELTRSCWESQLDYRPHLILFTRLFIAGDYALALEAFSVIENTCLEHEVVSEVIAEIINLLTASLPDQVDVKQRLTKELIQILEPYNCGF